MQQQNPIDTINKVTEAINRGDMSEMLGLFEPDAVLMVKALAGQAGETAHGKEEIRKAYEGFFSLKPVLHRVAQQVEVADNIALHFSKWTLTATSPDGERTERTAVSADVLRKQPDGRWLVLIYNPYGSSSVDS